MTTLLISVPDFALANPIYRGGTVTFWAVDVHGNRLDTLGAVYADALGNDAAPNPLMLDGDGKFPAPIFVNAPVIAEVTGPNVGSHHYTGIISSFAFAEPISPLGDGQDDWPALYAAMVANAYVRRTVMAPGTWLCKSFAGGPNGRNIPDGTHLIAHPGVIIESSLDPAGEFVTGCVFSANTQQVPGSSSTTLSVAGAVGDTAVTLANVAIGAAGANIAVGQELLLSAGPNLSFYYFVKAVDAGTKVVTLDRPLVCPIATGGHVGLYATPKDIRIEGNGMLIRGTGFRAINAGAWSYSSIEGVRVEPNAAGEFFSGANVVAYDIGARFSTMRDIEVKGKVDADCFNLVASESNENCYFENIYCADATDGFPAFSAISSFHCTFVRVRTDGGAYGIVLGSGGDNFGCRECTLIDPQVTNSLAYGIGIINGSSFNKIIGGLVQKSTYMCLDIEAGVVEDEPTRGNIIVGLTSRENAMGAVHAQDSSVSQPAPAHSNVIEGMVSERDGGFVFNLLNSLKLSNIVILDPTGDGGVYVQDEADCDISNFRIERRNVTGSFVAITHVSTGVVTIDGLRAHQADGAGTYYGILQSAGKLIYSNALLTGDWSYGYASNNAASNSKRDASVDFAIATTPFTVALGTHAAPTIGPASATDGGFAKFDGPTGKLLKDGGLIAPGDLDAGDAAKRAAFLKALGAREVLAGNRMYFVRADGIDTNDGLSDTSGGALLTRQKAADVVATLDIGIYGVTVQVQDDAAGTVWTAGCTIKAPVGVGAYIWQGNTGTPGNCFINSASQGFIIDGATVTLQGFKLSAAGYGVMVINGGVVNFGAGMEVGDCASAVLYSQPFGKITFLNDFTIFGTSGLFALLDSGAVLYADVLTITLAAGTAWSIFIQLADGAAYLRANTFVGTATGIRFYFNGAGFIQTNGGGASYLPGNSAGVGGTVSGNGVYL